MSVLNKYINSSNFLTATAVYNDINLTTIASDGYYQFEGNYRQQLSGVLGPLVLCDPCSPPAIPCGVGVNPPDGRTGLYDLTFNSGDTAADVGAIVIYFNPAGVPDGLRVLYDGVYYNAVSSPTNGRIQSTSGVSDSFTLLGNSNACVPTLPNTSNYNYYNGFTGATWNPGTPTVKSVTLNAGDDQYGGASEYSTLVVPKPNQTPANVTVQVLGPCSGTVWGIEVDCPAALPSFTASANVGSSTACTPTVSTYYFAKHQGEININPILTSWVFSDSNGSTALTNGNYVLSNNNVITVTNGVVTSVVTCTGAENYAPFHVTTGSSNLQEGMCNVVSTVPLWHNGTGTLPQIGDVIYQGSSSGAATATWNNYKGSAGAFNATANESIRVNGFGVVLNLIVCP